MRITSLEDYGLRCIISLAKRFGQGPATVREVSRQENVTAHYVEQIMLRLRRADLVRSVRGMRGGYVLARDPSTITVAQVMRALHRAGFEMVCHKYESGSARCTHILGCGVRPLWAKVAQSIERIYQETNIAHLLAEEEEVEKRLGVVGHVGEQFRTHMLEPGHQPFKGLPDA